MRSVTTTLLAVLCGCQCADAFEFRCRFVERVGNQDVVLPGNGIVPNAGLPRNIRMQIGVFDDAAGPAPAGGFVGWNVGTLTVSGSLTNSDERRNAGRLAPFTFAQGPNANGNPPAPAGDPFTMLTEIDATLGTQSPVWVCDAQGMAPPQPSATVRGRNTFVSVYAFQIDPIANYQSYTVTAGGNLIAASGWQAVGTPQPPDCGDPLDPSDDVSGSVTYAPVPLTPQSFTCVLNVLPIPTPTAAVVLGLGGIAVARRRRTR